MKQKILRLREHSLVILAICSLITLLALNVTYYIFDTKQLFIFNQIGSFNWVLSYFLIIVFSLRSFIRLVRLSFVKKWFLTLTVLLVFVFLSFFQATKTANVSHETTQEIACITNSKYLGEKYNQPCFLGYPARQYLIQALPSLLLTKSVLALNSGAILFFIPGLFIFSFALLHTNKDKKYTDEIVAITISMLFSFYFMAHFYFYNFEQSIFPLSFGLIGTGLGLLYKKSGKIETLFLLIILIQHAIFSYTPSLSLMPVLLLFLCLKPDKKNMQKKSWVFSILAGLIITGSSLAISIENRYDIRVLDKNGESSQTILSVIKETPAVLKHFFIQHAGGIEFVSPIILWIIFVAMLINIKRAKINFLIIIWALTTMIIATTSHGYAVYGLDFRAHRSLVVLPILMFGFGTSLIDFFQFIKYDRLTKIALSLMLIATTTLGVTLTNNYLNTKSVDDRTLLSLWLQKNLNSTQNYDLYIIGPRPYQDLLSLNDKLQYFAPTVGSQIIADDESCPSGKGVYFVNPISACLNSYQNSPGYQSKHYADSKGYEYEIFIKNY